MKKIYLLFTLVLFATEGCNEKAMQYHQEIQQAQYFQVYKVAKTPTMPESQSPSKLYLMDYEVTDTRLVSGSYKQALKKALLNKENYSFEESKRCPFLAAYGIKIDRELTAIVGIEPCSKIMIAPADSAGHNLFDLAEKGEIERILGEIVSGDPNKTLDSQE